VQLLKIALFHDDGRMKVMDFQPGRLNVVLGDSRTGKSALLDIVDYCLGRDETPMPPGIIVKTVAWFGTLWQLDDGSGGRAFVGRPAIARGKASSSLAMIEFGAEALDLPTRNQLRVNTDSDGVREQLGARMGLEEARLARAEGSSGTSFAVGLGAASFYSFQTQFEIANKALLFHRQGDEGIPQTIKDTLPFFLGVIQGDQAQQRAELRQASRSLRRAEAALLRAEDEVSETDIGLRALLEEAYAVGLTQVSRIDSLQLVVDTLHQVRLERSVAPPADVDLKSQDRMRELQDRKISLRKDLGGVLDERELVLESLHREGGYDSAVKQQLGRLGSLNLVGRTASGHADTCPVCKQAMKGSDPTVDQLERRLTDLRDEIENLGHAQPGRQKALNDLGTSANAYRAELITVDEAIKSLVSAEAGTDRIHDSGKREFIRGRIDATLGRTPATDDSKLVALRKAVTAANRRVDALSTALDDEDARERLTSVLNVLGADMTRLAQELELEHSENDVRLDLSKLTVITDTADGPAPLKSLGSGANWVGYHLVVHLALHRFFIAQNRPLPRLLMIDQPSQVFYEGNRTKNEQNDDRDAVRRMFKMLHDICRELAPDFQIILSEHAEIDEDWFSDSVVATWRGEGLVPADWAQSDQDFLEH